MKKHIRRPVLGPEFDGDQMNVEERITAYCDTLQYYRPRGCTKLIRDGHLMVEHSRLGRHHATEFWTEWANEADDLLTTWARRIERHDYIAFGPFEHSGDVGFYYCVDSAMEEAVICIAAGDAPPKGVTGTVVTVNDHGNVTAYAYWHGRKTRELFAAV